LSAGCLPCISGCRPASPLRLDRAGHYLHLGGMAGWFDRLRHLSGPFSSYVTTYAGLASIMIAVVFLYMVSAIFILGGKLS
jgi:hypothetical protein